MSIINVGIGEWKISSEPGDIIKTYALGSCVAVIIQDVKLKSVGLIHIALPDSSIDPEKAHRMPGYFADTGLSTMIEEMKKKGSVRPNIRVKLVGGAAVMDDKGFFDIGKRNLLAVKKILWKSSLGAIAEDTGGEISRTVSVNVSDGDTLISSGKRQWKI